MKYLSKSLLFKLAIICFAFAGFLLIPHQLHAARSLEIKSKDDLNHKSGKLGAYRALVIGINDYQDKKIHSLKTAVNDAREVARVLQSKYGFKVDLLLDRRATRKEIIEKLRDLAANSSAAESVLIYYAGHGDIDRVLNDGWWVPADAKGGDSSTYLDNTMVQKAMKGMKARHVLLVSDSCYSGTLFGEGRSLPPLINDKYYLNLYNEKSRWGMTSGNKTPVSDSGSEGHSIFAYQLIKALKKNDRPYITTQEIYTQIAPIIANNSEQQPLCNPVRDTGDQGGGFVFVASIASSTSDATSYTKKEEQQAEADELAAQKETLAREKKDLARQKELDAEREKLDAEQSRLEEEKASFVKKKALDEKRQQIEEERERLAAQQEEARQAAADRKKKALDEKRQKIAEEKERLEAEKEAARQAELERKQAKKTLAMAPRPSVSTSNVIGRDGRFTAYSNGTVLDTRTNLMLAAKDNGSNINWQDAKAYCGNYRGGGYSDWRMPTQDELAGLYDAGKSRAGACNTAYQIHVATELIDITCFWAWASETRGSEAATFGFNPWLPVLDPPVQRQQPPGPPGAVRQIDYLVI